MSGRAGWGTTVQRPRRHVCKGYTIPVEPCPQTPPHQRVQSHHSSPSPMTSRRPPSPPPMLRNIAVPPFRPALPPSLTRTHARAHARACAHTCTHLQRHADVVGRERRHDGDGRALQQRRHARVGVVELRLEAREVQGGRQRDAAVADVAVPAAQPDVLRSRNSAAAARAGGRRRVAGGGRQGGGRRTWFQISTGEGGTRSQQRLSSPMCCARWGGVSVAAAGNGARRQVGVVAPECGGTQVRQERGGVEWGKAGKRGRRGRCMCMCVCVWGGGAGLGPGWGSC